MATMTPQENTSITGFGLALDEDHQERHFLVIVPEKRTLPVSISEHTRWSESEALRTDRSGSLAYRLEMRRSDSVRVLLPHDLWFSIADVVEATFNARLKRAKKRAARWKRGGRNPAKSLLTYTNHNRCNKILFRRMIRVSGKASFAYVDWDGSAFF